MILLQGAGLIPQHLQCGLLPAESLSGTSAWLRTPIQLQVLPRPQGQSTLKGWLYKGTQPAPCPPSKPSPKSHPSPRDRGVL